MAKLKRQGRVVFNGRQAHSVLTFVFGRVQISARDLTVEDIKFAQALMAEMLSASFHMGFIEELFGSTARLPSTVLATIRAILKSAAKSTIRYRNRDELVAMLAEPVIYSSVRSTLRRNFRSAWRIRESNMDLPQWW